MTVTRLWVHPRGNRKELKDLTTLPDGSDLLHLFHGFAADVSPDKLLKATTESFANVHAVSPKGRTITMAVDVGRYGETGAITNVHTMVESGRFSKDDATSVVTHGVFLLPSPGTSALLFTERSANQSGVLRILELFAAKFKTAYPDLILETESLVESEAWLKYAKLVRVSAYTHRRSKDLSDRSDVTLQTQPLGELAHTLLPPRGAKSLPRWVYDQLVNGDLHAGQLLQFSHDEEPDETEVTLEGNNQRKTFVLGREKRPSISYPLSDHGEDVWTDHRIRTFALEQAEDLFDRLGIDWSPADAIGTWTQAQLDTRLVNASGQQT
ncbi:hypothetical protein [Rhodococcus wratislaviensis]|uniref:hypothetical protein n=1 Tax=Rhodococcus wratislaviensis TaxID=44752 RepID=UPI003517FFE0